MRAFFLFSAFLFLHSLFGDSEAHLLIRAATVQATPDTSFQPGEILIRNDKIIAVGKKVALPKAFKLIDWNDYEVYPGLISPGSSLGLAEINALRPTRDEREVGSHTPEIEAWTAINPDSELIPVARANGITHSMIIPMGGRISGTSSLIALQGWGLEEMTKLKKTALHLWWPSRQLSVSDEDKAKSIDDQKKEQTRAIDEIDDFFTQGENYLESRKRQDDGFRTHPGWEAMIPFLQGKLPLMIHANDRRQIQDALDWAEKRKYKIILSGARDGWMLARRIAQNEIPVVFRHIFTAPLHPHDPHDLYFSAPSILAAEGVDLSIGLPLGAWSAANQRNLPYHAAHGVAYGLSRKDALASVTINPANLLGVSHLLGSIEKGKEATLIACSGDLLDLRSRITGMLIAGKSVSLESRHTRLFKKYSERPRQNPK